MLEKWMVGEGRRIKKKGSEIKFKIKKLSTYVELKENVLERWMVGEGRC